MSSLNEPVAKRIATLFRMLSSPYDGEVLNAVTAMKRLFAIEGLAFNDIATVIESCNGEIEERKYSDRDAEIIFAHGVKKGRAESRGRSLSANYFDDDGEPRWAEIAKFCHEHPALRGLKPNEQEFIDGLQAKLRWRSPSRAMGGFALSIFWKLGGSLK
jgi:hypothetical protein